MKALGIGPEDIPTEALEYLGSFVRKETNGYFTVDECVKMIVNPQNEFEKAMQLAMKKDETIKAEIIQKASKRDFRSFLKDVIDGQADNIPESLNNLREIDPGEYNRTLQGWVKIAYPQQKDINVNVDIEQKITMYQRMQEQYGYSMAVEAPEEAQLIEAPIEEPMAVPVQSPSERIASTFDTMFFENPEETTPTPVEDENEEEHDEDYISPMEYFRGRR